MVFCGGRVVGKSGEEVGLKGTQHVAIPRYTGPLRRADCMRSVSLAESRPAMRYSRRSRLEEIRISIDGEDVR